MVEEVRRLIWASLGNRAKESLGEGVDFINQTDLDTTPDKSSSDAFFSCAQREQQREVKDMRLPLKA